MIYDGYDHDAGRNVEPYIIIYNPIVIRIKSYEPKRRAIAIPKLKIINPKVPKS